MRRFALVICMATAAAAVVAAPAPFQQPVRRESGGPWVRGWGKPTDPLGGSDFDRRRDRLTITLPAITREAGKDDLLRGPHLLRKVSGDFIAAVRVSGPFWRDAGRGTRVAGLVVTDGSTAVMLGRYEFQANNRVRLQSVADIIRTGDGRESFQRGDRLQLASDDTDRPAYLRLTRAGRDFWFEFSFDEKKWFSTRRTTRPCRFPLATTVWVGVIAEANPAGEFAARYDRFSLNRTESTTEKRDDSR